MSRTSNAMSSKNPMFDEEELDENGSDVVPAENNDIETNPKTKGDQDAFKPIFKDFLWVKNELNIRNIAMLPLASFYLGFIFMFLFNFQTFFLLNKQENKFTEFDKPVQRMDTTQQVWSLIFALIWGHVSDKYGRRLVMSLGFIQMALGLFFIPTTKDIIPGYMITYLLFAQGYVAAFVALLGLIFDYYHKKSIVQALSVHFTTYSVGTLLGGTTYTYSAPESLCINNTYHVAGAFSLVIAILSFMLLKTVQVFPEVKTNICSAVKNSIKSTWSNKVLFLALIGGAMAFAANIVPRFFIVGWMHRDFHDRGACGRRCIPIGNNVCYERISACDEDIRDLNKVGCNDGHTRMMDMARVVAPLQIATSIIFFIVYKLDETINLLLTSIFVAITFGLVTSIQNYSLSEQNAMVLNYFWAIGGILGLLSAINLLLQQAEANKSGLMCGLFYAFTQIGALFAHGLGGYLFGVKTIGAPFLVVMWLAILSASFCAILLVYNRNNS